MFSIFKRNRDIKDAILDAMVDQQRRDEAILKKALEQRDIEWERKFNLAKQSTDAKIKMLEYELEGWEKRKKELDAMEYNCKMQIATNYQIAQQITNRTQSASLTFAKEIGELQGVFDDAKDHHKRLEEK